jgi:hypothetical protein
LKRSHVIARRTRRKCVSQEGITYLRPGARNTEPAVCSVDA